MRGAHDLGLVQLLLAGARLRSRPTVLRYANDLSVLLALVAGHRDDLVSLLGFRHVLPPMDLSRRQSRQRPWTAAERWLRLVELASLRKLRAQSLYAPLDSAIPGS